MLPQSFFSHKSAPGNTGTTGDGIGQLITALLIIACLLVYAPTPAQAHSAPSACSVRTSPNTGYKIIFVGHIKDGESVYSQQDGASTMLSRGHTYTTSASPVTVYKSNGWVAICSG